MLKGQVTSSIVSLWVATDLDLVDNGSGGSAGELSILVATKLMPWMYLHCMIANLIIIRMEMSKWREMIYFIVCYVDMVVNSISVYPKPGK